MAELKGGRALKIETSVAACTGCRICELVCSFHQERVFSPELSSIRILRNNRTAAIELSIDSTCDLCVEENVPQCIKYCVYGALKGGR